MALMLRFPKMNRRLGIDPVIFANQNVSDITGIQGTVEIESIATAICGKFRRPAYGNPSVIRAGIMQWMHGIVKINNLIVLQICQQVGQFCEKLFLGIRVGFGRNGFRLLVNKSQTVKQFDNAIGGVVLLEPMLYNVGTSRLERYS